jgi:hypothetical protein
MKDKNGLYYYPFIDNKRVRMYVKDEDGSVWFRLWNAEEPELWDEHGWVPHGAIEEAKLMYEGKSFDPAQAYDLEIARTIIEEYRNDAETT